MPKWKSDPFKVRKSRYERKPSKSNADLAELLALKLKLEATKPLYSLYDSKLQDVINSGRLNGHPQVVNLDGVKWIIEVVDQFSNGRNTAWKSTATRRFDINVSKARAIK